MTTVSTIVLALVIPALLAIATHYLLYNGVEQPESSHGTGSMFDLIAPRYDTINRILALGMDTGWRVQMVQQIKQSLSELDSTSSPRILDVSTGTADVALLLSKYIPKAQIIGIDPSEKMLDIGRQKIQQLHRQDRISLQQFDARDTALASTLGGPSSFDAATWAFGIRNVVPRRHAALCRIHGLLQPQARLAILEFSEPTGDDFGLGGVVMRWLIRNAVPLVGGLLSGAPQEYWHLQASIQEFPSPREFVRQIHALQCSDDDDRADDMSVEEGSDDTDNDDSNLYKFFKVERVHQINFGSVQIYMLKTIKEPQQQQQPESEPEPQ